MKPTHTIKSIEETRQSLIRVIFVFVAYYGLWVLSRLLQPVSYAVYSIGIAFPLLSAMVTRDWSTMGFTRRNWKQALFWGMTVGLIFLLVIGIVPKVLGLQPSLETPPQQLLGGIIIAFLVISPYQEFLFRGWIQPRLESALGMWQGLIDSLFSAFCYMGHTSTITRRLTDDSDSNFSTTCAI
jgi:membrane protease YdiL (CAAX protease family)